MGDGRRGERVGHEMPPGSPAAYASLTPRGSQQEIGPFQAAAGYLRGAHFGSRPKAEGADLGPSDLAHRGHARIVGVQDGQAVRWKGRRQL